MLWMSNLINGLEESDIIHKKNRTVTERYEQRIAIWV